jgi:chromosome segregation ATPase
MDSLALIEAHCRFVAGQMPRAAQGCRIALALLSAIPGACARKLPDVTGTRTQLFEALVRFGLLPALPSRHTQTGALRLLGKLTPLVEARSERHWALWLAHAQDPASPIAARVQAGTPEHQRTVHDPGEIFSPLRSRDYTHERAELRKATASADRAREDAERRAEELRVAHAQVEGAALALRAERDALAAKVENLERRQREFESEQTRLTSGLASAKEQLGRLQQEAATACEGRDKARRAAETLQGQLAELQRELAAARAARRAEVDKVADLQQQLESAAHDVAEERAARTKAEEASALLRTDLSTLKPRIARLEKVERELEIAQSERDVASSSAREARSQHAQARESLVKARERIATLEYEAAVEADKLELARREASETKKTSADLAAKVTQASTETANLRKNLTALTQERDLLREALAEESQARAAVSTQRTRLEQDLTSVRGERDAANEKIQVVRDRLRRQTAEIAVRQRRAPLPPEVIAQEVDEILARPRE